MTSFFFFNLNNYEMCLKFNYTSTFQLPQLSLSDFTLSFKTLKEQPVFATQALYSSLLLFNQLPKPVFIRKPSAYFKTRKGDPYGFKLRVSGLKSLDFFLHNWLDAIPEAREYGYFDNFNLGLSGHLQFGLRSLKVFPLIKNSPLNRLYFLGGCDLKFSLLPALNSNSRGLKSSASTKRKSLVFFSDFSFFEHVQS